MSERHKKAIHFDLDTRKLKRFYPGRDYRYAYRELKKFFVERGFTHRQYSGYVSNEKLSRAEILYLLEELRKKFAWIKVCIRKLDVTDIGLQFDLASLLQRFEDSDFTVQIDIGMIWIEMCSRKIVQSSTRQQRHLLAYAKYFQQRGKTGNPAVAGT